MNQIIIIIIILLINLCKWAHKFCSDDAVKSVMPKTHKLLEIAKFLMSKFTATAPPACQLISS